MKGSAFIASRLVGMVLVWGAGLGVSGGCRVPTRRRGGWDRTSGDEHPCGARGKGEGMSLCLPMARVIDSLERGRPLGQ